MSCCVSDTLMFRVVGCVVNGMGTWLHSTSEQQHIQCKWAREGSGLRSVGPVSRMQKETEASIALL